LALSHTGESHERKIPFRSTWQPKRRLLLQGRHHWFPHQPPFGMINLGSLEKKSGDRIQSFVSILPTVADEAFRNYISGVFEIFAAFFAFSLSFEVVRLSDNKKPLV
jgi:hypothetical protein